MTEAQGKAHELIGPILAEWFAHTEAQHAEDECIKQQYIEEECLEQ